MSSEGKSHVGESFVSKSRIIRVAIYLTTLCLFLFYTLVALWPSAPLMVSSLQPSRGSSEGGGSVTVAGVGFATGVTVHFGDTLATNVNSVMPTAITLSLPRHVAGKVPIQVAYPNGQEVRVPDAFTYVDPIVITKINPASAAPGETLTILGSGFPEGSMVKIGGVPATANRTSGTQLIATVPQHDSASADVEVDNDSGDKAVAASAFTFVKAADQKAANTTAPGTTEKAVNSTFTVFTVADPGPGVYRSADATNLYCVKYFGGAFWLSESVRLLLIIMIVGALGSLIHVFHSFYWYVGNRRLRNSWLLMYLLLPFNGAGLALLFYLIIRGGISTQVPVSQSSVDGYAAIAALVGLFSREAQAKLKKIAESFFSIADKGSDQANPAPSFSIASVSPPTGAPGDVVTITGVGFTSTSQVKFGDTHADTVTFVSGTELRATAPVHAAGLVDIEVSNAPDCKTSCSRSFTYGDAKPDPGTVAALVTVTTIDPDSDTTKGGTKVTITGTGFSTGSQVKFGDVLATNVNVASPTQLTMPAPAHDAGTIDVEVANGSGIKGSKPKAFTYTDGGNAPPTPVDEKV